MLALSFPLLLPLQAWAVPYAHRAIHTPLETSTATSSLVVVVVVEEEEWARLLGGLEMALLALALAGKTS